jgi:Tol biopolymer transport system component
VWRVVVVASVLVASATLLPAQAGGPYGMDRPFHVAVNAFTFGQAPAFMPDGRVAYHDDLGDGEQIYVSDLDGGRRRCVTCGQEGPNQVPQPRPQGDVILYHSWQGNVLNVGSAGFGGLGTDLWVVGVDGRAPVNLTNSGEGEDNYHAAWSPDGRRVSWAYLNWNFVTMNGRGHWDVRVADYIATPTPHLENVRVVRPANGHYYETQVWAPDGSGFLYSETVDNAMNLELFFCRLRDHGCDVERLTDHPAWDEQAVFTPDGESVVFMSTRATPGVWNTWAAASAAAGLPNDLDYVLTLPLFAAGFLQPVGAPTTDLYQLDLESRVMRRLTFEGRDGWIIPEFAWDPTGSFLLWTEQKYPDGVRVPLPLDLAAQLEGVRSLLAHPPSLPGGEALRPGGGLLPILAARTMVGAFG